MVETKSRDLQLNDATYSMDWARPSFFHKLQRILPIGYALASLWIVSWNICFPNFKCAIWKKILPLGYVNKHYWIYHDREIELWIAYTHYMKYMQQGQIDIHSQENCYLNKPKKYMYRNSFEFTCINLKLFWQYIKVKINREHNIK